MKLYHKRDYFVFTIVNFPFIFSYIPEALVSLSGNDIPECGPYNDILHGNLMLTKKLPNQEFK